MDIWSAAYVMKYVRVCACVLATNQRQRQQQHDYHFYYQTVNCHWYCFSNKDHLSSFVLRAPFQGSQSASQPAIRPCAVSRTDRWYTDTHKQTLPSIILQTDVSWRFVLLVGIVINNIIVVDDTFPVCVLLQPQRNSAAPSVSATQRWIVMIPRDIYK